MNNEHLIHELQQIILLQKKLDHIIDAGNQDKSEQIPQLIDHIESTHRTTKKFVDNVLSDKTKLDQNFLSVLNHELRTPLVPIRSYTEMLSCGKFGELNEEQKKRLDIVVANVNLLQQKIETMLDKKITDVEGGKSHHLKETQQVSIVLKRLNDLLTSEIKQDVKRIDELQSMLTKSNQNQKECKQEEMILGKLVKDEEQRNRLLSKKYIMTIAGAAITIAIITTGYSLLVVELVGQQYQMTNLGEIKSNYVVQNLKGDTIDTWLSWRLVDGSILNVNVIDGEKYPDKGEIVKTVILSDESIDIDDSLLHKGPKGTTSTYYIGWAGALASTKTSSEFYIPQKYNLIESPKGEGDITIKLTSQSSGDGYSGYTKSIADDAQNQILKSEITIYEVDKLSKAQFETILRHEFGHALGLAHSTATEDLMYPTITTNYPYISECDVDAIVLLYDGGESSKVICEK